MPLHTDYIGYKAGEQFRAGEAGKPAAHYAGLIDNASSEPKEYIHVPEKLLALSVRVFPKDRSNIQATLTHMKFELEGILNLNGIKDYQASDFMPTDGIRMLGKEIPSNIYSITFGNIPSSDYDKLTKAIEELEKTRSKGHELKIRPDDPEPTSPKKLPPKKVANTKAVEL